MKTPRTLFTQWRKTKGSAARRRIKNEIMNLLAITTHCSRSVSFDMPVLRTMFHREKKTRRKTQRDGMQCAQRVHMEFHPPLTHKVEIAGSFNDWRPGATWMVPLGDETT